MPARRCGGAATGNNELVAEDAEARREVTANPAGGGRIRLWALVLSLLCAVVAHAEPAIQAVRFTVFSPRPVSDVAYVPRANAPPQSLKFQPTARSPRYEYDGTMPLRFVDPESRTVVAEATIPAGLHDVLLLFSPIAPGATAAAPLRYQVAVLDDSAVRQGPGGLAIINLSGLALSGNVNDRAITLRPGLNPTIPVARAATIRLTTVFKQRSYQSYAGTVTLGRNERALLILFPPFNPGGLEVQSRLLLDQPPGTSAAVPRKK